MKKVEGIIFDMDGCLYQFDKGTASTFTGSQFGRQLRENAIQFFQTQFGLSVEDAEARFTDIKNRWKGEISLGLEKEFGIPRKQYFNKTWDLDPQAFMRPQEALIASLESLTIQSGLLSAAPDIWVGKVLEFLRIKHVFGSAVFTGEPDIRKPDPAAFLQVANFLQLSPSNMLSVGDQEETDILPAKSLGMKTLHIGTVTQTEADFVAADVVSAIALLKKENIV